MKAIWGKNLSEEMNITLAFSLDLKVKTQCEITLAAASCYKIYIDGNFLAFGPQRSAHRFARKKQYIVSARNITVEVASVYSKNFCWIKQKPFFACEVIAENGKKYETNDFICYRLIDRKQKVARYSYQRGFAEFYEMIEDRLSLYRGKSNFPHVETEFAELPEIWESRVDEPKYNLHFPFKAIERGTVKTDETLEVWRDRAQTMVGGKLDGFPIDAWEDRATDEASKFVYIPDGEQGKFRYQTVDFARALTGFAEMEITAKNAGDVYVIFDEVLLSELGRGKNYISFSRDTCANVFKWHLKNKGHFSVASFEPYTMRYACIVTSFGIDAKIRIRDYENPNANFLVFDSQDKELKEIVQAARATLAQNSVDLLTDCPSRERAGWLADVYFSMEAERIFTGRNQALQTFLENYAYANADGLPQGMLPMCYPSENFDGFIPNYGLWYILILEKYSRRYGCDEIVLKSLHNVKKLLEYFIGFENEYGLLENLEGWVFIEWSKANETGHIKGVNIPSNITYAAALEKAAKLLNDESLKEKSEKIRKWIQANAFGSMFLTDNLVRDKNGKLIRTDLFTETCQYYAFWFECIDKKEYPVLYAELMDRLGVNRAEKYRPEVGKANVIFGLYMRLDLLMGDGRYEEVRQEIKKLFLPMARRTGTLWEHCGIGASCDHCFASYVIKWIIELKGKEMK